MLKLKKHRTHHGRANDQRGLPDYCGQRRQHSEHIGMMIGLGLDITSIQRGGAVQIITATTTPALGALSDGDTIASAMSANYDQTSNYASTEGTISTVAAAVTVNGTSALFTDTVAAGDVVVVTVTVTDSAANERAFNAGTRTAADIAPVASSAIADQSFTEDVAITPLDVSTDFTGTRLTFALAPSSAALPAGLSLSSAGVISGTPTTVAAEVNIVVRATNSAGTADTAFGVTIAEASALDPDAATYIAGVETADGEALEEGVKTAINDFVVGCKADGIWAALKAACILAGARTLNGALVPLAGAAPTNVNFVSADYNRKTGLVGNRTSKYLNTNRANNADPQNNQHLAVWLTETGVSGGTGIPILGDDISASGASLLFHRSNDNYLFKSRSSSIGAGGTVAAGFMGLSRDNSADFAAALGVTDETYTVASQTPGTSNITLFRALQNGVSPSYYNGRASFYSAGESLNLPALRTRVSNLMTALDGAIA